VHGIGSASGLPTKQNRRRTAGGHCVRSVATAATTETATAGTATTATAAAESTAATGAAAGTAATTETAAAGLLRPGFIDGEITTVDVLAVQTRNCRLRFLFRPHFNKAETLGATGFPIHDHLGRSHGAEIGKHLFKIALVYAVSQIAYVKLSTQLTCSKKG